MSGQFIAEISTEYQNIATNQMVFHTGAKSRLETELNEGKKEWERQIKQREGMKD